MSIKYIQLPTCKLAEFVGSAVTSFDVSGFLYNDGTTPVDPADIGDICYATLEPRTAREELISFTIDSVTAGGVATVTVTRGLSQKSPYGTGGASFDHQNGSDFVISNNPGLFNKLAAKANDEAITGSWSFPTPAAANNPVTKTYYDTTGVKLTGAQTVAGVKTFSSSPKIPDSTAVDEPVTRGELDGEEVKLTGDQTIAGVKTFSSAPLVPTSTASGEAVNKGQMEAYIAANSGDIKATDSVFGTSKLDTPADDIANPKVLTATADRVAALLGGGDFGTPDVDNKFLTEDYFASSLGFGDGSDGVLDISSGTTTLTSDKQYTSVSVTGTAILETAGYRIYSQGTVTIDATSGACVRNNGGNGGNASGATAGAAGTIAPGVTVPAGVVGLIGAAGRTGAAVGGADGSTGVAALLGIGVVGNAGGGGGMANAGARAGGGGGAAGSFSASNNKIASIADTIFIDTTSGVLAFVKGSSGAGSGGSGGHHSGTNSGAGGGSGATGGCVFIACGLLILIGVGAIQAKGGGGGNGSDGSNDGGNGGGGGGAGGAGGEVVLIYRSKIGTGTIVVTGGIGGVKGIASTTGSNGDGTNGVSGTTGKTYLIQM